MLKVFLVTLALATSGAMAAGSGVPAAQARPQARRHRTAPPALEAALGKLDEAELAGIRKRDLKFVDAEYAPDVVIFSTYRPLKYDGREGARTAWQSFFDRVAGVSKSEWTERLYHAAGPAAAWMTCLWHMEGANSDDQPLELNLRVTRVYEKRQGRWMVVHEHFSAPER